MMRAGAGHAAITDAAGRFRVTGLGEGQGTLTARIIGYVPLTRTAAGRRLAFAVYANNVPVSAEQGAIDRTIAQAVGEIAAAAYDAAPPPGNPLGGAGHAPPSRLPSPAP